MIALRLNVCHAISRTLNGSAAPMPSVFSARSFSIRPPGNDPLDVLRKECHEHKLCDEEGGRLPGAHWSFSVAIGSGQKDKAPILKTVSIERISSAGIDFVVKRGHRAAAGLVNGIPVSFLYLKGKMLPGETAEQWRGEGHCEVLPIEEVYHLIPHFTISSMVGSSRAFSRIESLAKKAEDEYGLNERPSLENKSSFIEIMLKTQTELENNELSMEEVDKCIRAFRLQPDRVECMVGGPDSVPWDRWEWSRDSAGDCPEGSIAWNEARQIVPH